MARCSVVGPARRDVVCVWCVSREAGERKRICSEREFGAIRHGRERSLGFNAQPS
jgi:hypothetical protein